MVRNGSYVVTIAIVPQNNVAVLEPDVALLLKDCDDQYEALAWQIFEDMLEWAEEYGQGHEDALNEVAGDVRAKYAYKIGELSGQRESLVTRLESISHGK